MQLDSLVMDREDAKERLVEYEKALRTERNAEDEAIAAGYRAAARGMPVVSLTAVLTAGGWFDDGLPRLAVVRANAEQCHVRVNRYSASPWSIVYGEQRWPDNRGALVGAHTVKAAIPGPDDWSRWGSGNGATIVPSVPPRHRPKRGRIGNFHVLWEVESWTPEPPTDPALLRHIRGDLWAVVATWDLTPLERAVLAQRQ